MLLQKIAPSAQKLLEKYLRADQKFAKVFRLVKIDFVSSNLTAHNWEHIYRDCINAIIIGEAEKADMRIVLPAIVMHDIGFLYGADGKTHGAIGADKLPTYLKKIKVAYPKKSVAHMADCIRTHKGSMHNEKPATLEAKVVADADLIEKFGPIGVYQYIRTFTEFNRGIESIIKRKDEIKWLKLETRTGRKIAEKGREFVILFFKQLDKSYNPYRSNFV